jgi:hypothetical protein
LERIKRSNILVPADIDRTTTWTYGVVTIGENMRPS